ncbi:MAG: hypothetical protein IT305_21815 [Chloroflexi bacterium]|nr:hypothetical protein [Chloroflexota bacterium]
MATVEHAPAVQSGKRALVARPDRPVRDVHCEARPHARVGMAEDRWFLAILTLGLLVATSIPYLYAYLTSPQDQQFMGLTYTTHDYAQYLSWARESRDRVFVENKLTPETSAATFFNLVWWSIGRLERLTGLSFFQINQGFRVFAATAFVMAIGGFAGIVFQDRGQRRFALALTCLTSGFGWLLVAAKPLNGDLVQPLLVHAVPSNTFFGMMVVPHMVLSAALVIAIFGLMHDAYARRCSHRAIAAGLLGLMLGFAHPYNIVTAYSVVGAFTVLVTLRDGLRPRWIAGLIAFYGLSAPSVLYWAWVSAGSDAWRQVLAQYKNLGVTTPDPVHLIVLLGAPLILALATFRGFVPLVERASVDLFVGAWLVVNLLIVYLPLNFQINLLNGIQVPLAILATQGLYRHVVPWLKSAHLPLARYVAPTVPALFLLLVLPTNLYLVSWRVLDLSRHNYPDFLYRDDLAALGWLEREVQPSDVVLSSLVVGHYVPGLTGAHAFLAHGANTLDFYGKRTAVERFYASDTDDTERERTLARYGVRYVFHGPAERMLGGFDPQQARYLEPAFTSRQTIVYRVRLP